MVVRKVIKKLLMMSAKGRRVGTAEVLSELEI